MEMAEYIDDDSIATKRRRHLTLEEKVMVNNVFEGLRAREKTLNLSEVLTLCSILTKVSETSVYRITKSVKEGTYDVPKVETRGRKKKIGLDNDWENGRNESIGGKQRKLHKKSIAPSVNASEVNGASDSAPRKVRLTNKAVTKDVSEKVHSKKCDLCRTRHSRHTSCSVSRGGKCRLKRSVQEQEFLWPLYPNSTDKDPLEVDNGVLPLDHVKVEKQEEEVKLEPFDVVDPLDRNSVIKIEPVSVEELISDIKVEPVNGEGLRGDIKTESESDEGLVSDIKTEPVSDIKIEPEGDEALVGDIKIEPEDDEALVDDIKTEPVGGIKIEPEGDEALVGDIKTEPIGDIKIEPESDIKIESTGVL